MSHARPHSGQPDSEDESWSRERLMAAAVEELLVERSLVARAGIARELDYWASRTPADGARLVACCWIDDAFAARAMQDVNAAAAEIGLDIGPTQVAAVANSPPLHNVLVCTLCSCYPIGLLGESPGWYKSRAYRSRVVREPRAVLAEFGLHLADDVEVRVHDSTADLRYIVIPMRPAGTAHLAEEALAGLVTRDCMIGTSLPRYMPA